MIKAIGNKKILLSKEEWEYYLEIEKAFGKDCLTDLFKTDKNGFIISVMPSTAKPTAMILIFFLLNVMLNQKLRKFDKLMNDTEKRLSKLENINDKV